MQNINFTTREFGFDYAHRVMCHTSKCANYHGHRGKMILKYSYNVDTTGDHIGYPLDFGEIKRVVCEWFDEYWDHGFLANPSDKSIIDLINKENKKLYIMNLGNPSAENIAKEAFYISDYLLQDRGLNMYSITFYETPNCFVECKGLSDKEVELMWNNSSLLINLNNWKKLKGIVEYDERKVNKCE